MYNSHKAGGMLVGQHSVPYVDVLKSVLKSQIEHLIRQLETEAGEESLVLTASLKEGTLSTLGSNKGLHFLSARDDLKLNFFSYCSQDLSMPGCGHFQGRPLTNHPPIVPGQATDAAEIGAVPHHASNAVTGNLNVQQANKEEKSLKRKLADGTITHNGYEDHSESGKTYTELQNVKALRLDSGNDGHHLSELREGEKQCTGLQGTGSILESILSVGAVGLSSNLACLSGNLSGISTYNSVDTCGTSSLMSSLQTSPLCSAPFYQSDLSSGQLDGHHIVGKPYQPNFGSVTGDKQLGAVTHFSQVVPQVSYVNTMESNQMDMPDVRLISVHSTHMSAMDDQNIKRRTHRLDLPDSLKTNQSGQYINGIHVPTTSLKSMKSDSPVNTTGVQMNGLSVTKSNEQFNNNPIQRDNAGFTALNNNNNTSINDLSPGEIVITNSSNPGEIIVKRSTKGAFSLLSMPLVFESQELTNNSQYSKTIIVQPLDESPANGKPIKTNGNVTDSKEKDKPRKTLSSKIKEITERIKKDEETTKLHTIHQNEIEELKKKLGQKRLKNEDMPKQTLSNPTVTEPHLQTTKVSHNINHHEPTMQPSDLIFNKGNHQQETTIVGNQVLSNMVSMATSHAVVTIEMHKTAAQELANTCSDDGSNSEKIHDGDLSKLKDVSRASHRKPKLPRFNIGEASDEEDNNPDPPRARKSLSLTNSPDKGRELGEITDNHGTDTGNSFHSMNNDESDILNINVSIDDNDSSFAYINLEELRASLMFNDNVTDMSVMGSSGDDLPKSQNDSGGKSVPKKGRNKKPLTADSILITESKKEKNWLQCRLCSERFKNIEALESHLENEAHVIKKFKCDICGRKFAQLRDAERHKRVHTGEKPFRCMVCNRDFARKDNLLSHCKRQHLQQDQNNSPNEDILTQKEVSC
ncbi:uncharacterized protein LOC127866134 [Dreissena polymorpha]|uniref:C2H2-type domain-containing protein n=1 Tax=Dreissena polymorpha TaxID=45954 RepID=A0A9D4LNZ7_DREPO|nr:uncharacterized protein LOC127866134 [Dreissena polymorpha]XP_052262503.1 uncharacterized protein LOC127866134 [Dreissena polymorpha]KAH3862043.1 hypothetical protein DPMN_024999 [Dreissena polymorpha]